MTPRVKSALAAAAGFLAGFLVEPYSTVLATVARVLTTY